MTGPVVNSACGLFLLWFLGIFEQGVFASEICVFHGDVLRMLHLYIYICIPGFLYVTFTIVLSQVPVCRVTCGRWFFKVGVARWF